METVFLACFLFGAVFTLVSVGLGFAGSAAHGPHAGHDLGPGHGGHAMPAAHGHDLGPGHGGHGAPAGHSHDLGPGHGGHGQDHGAGSMHHVEAGDRGVSVGRAALSLLNVSSILAFLTWFGAAGYLLLHFAAWSLLAAAPVAVVAGGAAASWMGLFLAKVRASERVMDPRAYRLEGTVARVIVSIPANGVGEVVFQKMGSRRSEAARGFNGRAIPRGAEVVIVDYQRGIATVDLLNELSGGQ